MLDILIDTLIDSVRLIPFLFITYLIMEFLEHKTSDKSKEKLKKAGKIGPLIGGLLGAFPQCGFSVSATNLYVGKIISMGALIAVYLSTSDEMVPILISEGAPLYIILEILIIKIIIGVAVGFIVDLLLNRNYKMEIESICEHEHCDCEHGVIKSSIKHTISITFFIFVITFILNALISLIGEENISNFMMNKTLLGPIFAGIVGLIPNCAASVIITELYLSSMISAGSLIAGLLVNAGIGVLVLFRMNHNLKENMSILSILYISGILCGIIFDLIGIQF